MGLGREHVLTSQTRLSQYKGARMYKDTLYAIRIGHPRLKVGKFKKHLLYLLDMAILSSY